MSMSHAARWERRRIIAREVRGGMSIGDVASKHEVTQTLVRSACREFGVRTIHIKRAERNAMIRKLAEQGLSRSDIARQLRLSVGVVYKALRDMGFPPASRKTLADWDSVNWRDTDRAIARKIGVSCQRVQQVRASRGIPTAGHYRRQEREARRNEEIKSLQTLAKAFGDRFSLLSRGDIQVMSGITRKSGFTKLLKEAGLRCRHGRSSAYPYACINWDLPSSKIDEIWDMPYNTAANFRKCENLNSPKWSLAFGRKPDDPGYLIALQEEKRKAADWFARRNVDAVAA